MVFKGILIDLHMSYIPKYVLKRMIPVDAIKIVGDNLEIIFVNIISPVQIKTLPENAVDYMSIKIDGQPLDKEIMEQMVFIVDEKEIPLSNPVDSNNLLVGVGTSVLIKVPNPGFQQGEEHHI